MSGRFLLALLLATGTAGAELAWQQPIQEFQVTPEQNTVEAKFAFKNVGKAPVTVKSMVTSCGCTTARMEKKTYAPGETGEVVSHYTFKMQYGALRKLITVTTDDGAPPVDLDIRVFRHEPFKVDRALVYWRTGDPAESQTVRVTANDYPVHVKSVASSDPHFTAELQTVKEGAQYAVLIRPRETGEKGSAEISVLTDFPATAPKTYIIHARVK